uniref:Uncharacterized protein n=1 Tax=Avena sativa TaxID=4498 RepID=A0ACD5X122_AVESA
MENQTQDPSPRWALLDRLGHRDDHADADSGTVASSQTSAGKKIYMSLRIAAPPATSRLYLRWQYGPTKKDPSFLYPRVVAVHGDAVLFQLISPSPPKRPRPIDYFVYTARGAARPPSLSLLKPYATKPVSPRQRMVDWKAIGILRPSLNAYAVAELSTTGDSLVGFELCCLIRSPQMTVDKWKVSRVEVVDEKGRNPELPSWESDAVVPVGDDRLLCWVDYHKGILLGDVFAANSAFRFEQLPRLPAEPRRANHEAVPTPDASRSLCASGDDGGTVRFVSVDRDPWPGVFRVTIWTLRKNRDGSMAWDKDVGVNAAELWAFSGYDPLPRVPPEYPVLSMDDPDTLCFLVREGSDTVRLVEVDMKRRTVRSVTCYGKEESRRKRKREDMRPVGYYQEGTQRMSSWYAPGPDKEKEDDVNITSTKLFHGHPFLPCSSKIVFRW